MAGFLYSSVLSNEELKAEIAKGSGSGEAEKMKPRSKRG